MKIAEPTKEKLPTNCVREWTLTLATKTPGAVQLKPLVRILMVTCVRKVSRATASVHRMKPGTLLNRKTEVVS